MDLKEVHQGIHKNKKAKRVGRGPGSKKGRTATRGNNGQRSRSGDKPPLLTEGGQMQLFRRMPKRGFNNKSRLNFAVINVVDLGNFQDNDVVSIEVLKESGLANHPHDRIKILGDGDIERKLEVHAHAFSKTAKEKIEKAGGSCVVDSGPHRGPKIRNKMRPRAPK